MLAEEGFVHRRGETARQWNWTNESYPPTPSACARSRPTTSSSSTPRNGARRDRRDRLHQRAVHAAREGDLHPRRAAVPGRAARLRRPQGVRPRGRLRLLHRRDHVHEGDDPRHVRVESGGRPSEMRESTRLETGPAGAAQSHGEVHVVSRVVGFKKIKFYTNENVGSGELDLPEQQMHTIVVLADDSARRDGGAAVRRRRPARRRRRAGVRDAAGRAAAADVRRPRHRHLDRRRVARAIDAHRRASAACRRRSPTSRTSSSTTTIPAASASASRCSTCTTLLLARTRELIAGCACESRLPVVRRARKATPVRTPSRSRRGSSSGCSRA